MDGGRHYDMTDAKVVDRVSLSASTRKPRFACVVIGQGLTPSAVINWVADSGALNHTTSDAGNLTIVRSPNSTDPSSIIVAYGSALPVTSVGETTLPVMCYLNNILVFPDIIRNLLSIHHISQVLIQL
jgi:hypothetical protein